MKNFVLYFPDEMQEGSEPETSRVNSIVSECNGQSNDEESPTQFRNESYGRETSSASINTINNDDSADFELDEILVEEFVERSPENSVNIIDDYNSQASVSNEVIVDVMKEFISESKSNDKVQRKFFLFI